VQRFRAQRHLRALVLWLRVEGMVACRRRRWEEASRAFAEAVSLARAMPYPYAEGRIRYEDGLLHLQRGEPGPARERLAEALAIFRRLGAAGDAERAGRAIAAL
jgi:hypothetical protein